jgi:hypothetical protein
MGVHRFSKNLEAILKILGAIRMTFKSHYDGPQILDVIVQNLVECTAWRLVERDALRLSSTHFKEPYKMLKECDLRSRAFNWNGLVCVISGK